MQAFVENIAGTTLKKEFDEKTKCWKKIGKLAKPYPYPYGFIVGTMQEDGDPLDVFVLTKNPRKIRRGDVFEIKVLGLVEYFESEERDYKILASINSEDIEITDAIKSKIEFFLNHAFDNIPGKKVKFNGFYPEEKAMEEIKRCRR